MMTQNDCWTFFVVAKITGNWVWVVALLLSQRTAPLADCVVDNMFF